MLSSKQQTPGTRGRTRSAGVKKPGSRKRRGIFPGLVRITPVMIRNSLVRFNWLLCRLPPSEEKPVSHKALLELVKTERQYAKDLNSLDTGKRSEALVGLTNATKELRTMLMKLSNRELQETQNTLARNHQLAEPELRNALLEILNTRITVRIQRADAILKTTYRKQMEKIMQENPGVQNLGGWVKAFEQQHRRSLKTKRFPTPPVLELAFLQLLKKRKP